ncbi:hypothetical protein [Rhizobium sp. Leaf383]|uniref:hypothetical protein n=1 Tax=Rhizobium sp. Leaf383 TaxID=1736357 RepID=UPI0007130767|nr:hypothetical protein [Rhizobium sp. Leaf383]KQS84842.1 hypothetical protein ASG58_20330 [Rhizobium sp. Leaf383]
MNTSTKLAHPNLDEDDVIKELDGIEIPEGLFGHDIAEACLDIARGWAKGRGCNVSEGTLTNLAERMAMSRSKDYRRYRAWSFAAGVVEDGVSIDFSIPTGYHEIVQRVDELHEYIRAARGYEQEGYADEQDELDALCSVLETIRSWSGHDEDEGGRAGWSSTSRVSRTIYSRRLYFRS